MPIYLKPIPGMDIPEGKMPYLNKSLYGTVDAGNLWQKEVYQLLTVDLLFEMLSKHDVGF